MVQITQFLRRAVQTRPHAVATKCDGRVRTWREFEGRAVRLAGALARLGYVPGDRIGMLALNCDRYLEYFFAMAWGGYVFVPINTRLAPPEIAFWLSDSGCSALFIDDAFLPMLGDFIPHAPDIRNIIRVGDGPAPAGLLAYEDLIADGAAASDAGKNGDDLAGIFYTGGTTGRSKGVMLSHRSIAANMMFCAAALGFDAQTIYLHAAPMFHLADGATTFLVTALGGTHLFMPRFEPGALIETIERHGVTATLIVPTMINMMVHHPKIETTDTSSLRADSLWRLADARGSDPPGLESPSAHRLRAGLRPVRSLALHDIHAQRISYDRGALRRQVEGGGSARDRLRNPHSRRER